MIKQTATTSGGGAVCSFLMYYLKWSIFNIKFVSSKETGKCGPYTGQGVGETRNKNCFEGDEMIDLAKTSKHYNTYVKGTKGSHA